MVPSRLIAVGRSLRATGTARWLGDRLLERQYRLGRAGGRPDRVVRWLINHDIVPVDRRRRSVEELAELFFELVEATGVDTFVEAGAKDAGASVRAASELGLTDVVAFEANPYTHRRFVRAVTDEGVRYEHLALSDVSGSVDFLVRLDAKGAPIADGQASLLVRPDHTPGYERVSVEAVRLDDHLPTSEIQRAAMWIDVEGASSLVLRGATRLLSKVSVVIIEVEESRSWIGQEWLHDDVLSFFVELGFRPVARDAQSRSQFNVVFVRNVEDPTVARVIEGWRSTLGSAEKPAQDPRDPRDL